MTEPGSGVELRRVRTTLSPLLDGYVFRLETPAILVAEAQKFKELLVADWQLEGKLLPLTKMPNGSCLPAWVARRRRLLHELARDVRAWNALRQKGA